MGEQLPTEPGYYLGRTGVLYRLGTDHIFRDETGRKRWVSETLVRLVPLSDEDCTLIARVLDMWHWNYPGSPEYEAVQALAARIAPDQNGQDA